MGAAPTWPNWLSWFVVQLLSGVLFFVTPWTAARQASLSFTISWSLIKLMCIESVMPPNHLILCHPLLLPSVFPSIRVFSSELALHIRWPKYWTFSFSISLSNESSGLYYFRIDWFDLLAAQETLKSWLQHHSLKPSILWCSAFFIIQLSHPYMTNGFIFAITLQGSDSGCFPFYFTDEEKTFSENLKKTAKKDNIKHKENSADIWWFELLTVGMEKTHT